MKCDVAVVGAGPSGSSVARFASRAGLSVVVLEKKRRIGHPSPCAGYVSRLLSRYFKIEPSCIQQGIEHMLTHLPSGATQLADMKGWIVDRPSFDASLAAQAAGDGAEFLPGARAVGLIKDGGTVKGVEFKRGSRTEKIEASVVVGADGPASRVAKWAGLPENRKENFAICPQYEMAGVALEDPETAHTFFGVDYAPGAYAWVYPTGPDSAKVGLGMKRSLAGRKPREYLEHFVRNHPTASPMLKNARITDSLTAPLALGGPVERTCGDGVLLVGDAAGMCDPISGAGIMSGVIAGRCAAETIAWGMEEGDVSARGLAGYERRWKKVLGTRLERSRRKREIADGAYTTDEELEQAIPSTWITFRGFWR